MRMNEIVGNWLRGYRVEHGLTLDQIADASHRYGSGWNNVNVLRMEKGGSKVDALPTLMVLLATLNDLVGEELKLADVFTDYAGIVNIGDYETSYENVVSALEGGTASFHSTNEDLKQSLYDIVRNEDGAERPEAEGVRVRKHLFVSDVATPRLDPTATPMFIINHYPTMAEKRLWSRLLDGYALTKDEAEAVNKIYLFLYKRHYEGALPIAAICDVLYGHSLDEEAAKRAGEGATPQKRGRVTRVLADEILDYMRKVAAKLED